MTPERWQQIRAVYEHAESLGSIERTVYLDRACALDAELRGEVESLFGYEQRAASGFLKTPAADLLEPLPQEERPSRVGTRVGVYQILDGIGQGGMGEVYRAARADGQYDKQVAIKLVRGGLDISFILQRFRHERQILASLDHPNIARLLDGGTTEDGIPYLVMELVEGVRIDDYCQSRKLSIGERLELFRQVCGAVQYAHQRLVIHRDLKPGNILVTDEGVPKLLDFGIAKILDSSAAAEITLARPMTPEYASPEQIRGEPITTASDVYSLGVVLYRLLTGRSPYRTNTKTTQELSRSITDTEAQRPSVAVLPGKDVRAEQPSADTAREGIISSRETSPGKLQRRLSGDVDNIVLMALRKEPGRRYASVQQFADDISRHLQGMPVTAAKDSWNYRAGKFIRRHKAGVLAVGFALIALAVGIALILRGDRIARAERARAESRFNDVRKLANSLIFDVNDAMADLPGNTSARKLLLDRAVEYLDKLTQDAVGNSDLQRELAVGYQRLAAVQGSGMEANLGQVSAAEISNRKAMALFEAVAKGNPNNTIDQLNLAKAHRMMGIADIYYPGGRQEISKAISITDRLMQTDGANTKVRMERALEYQGLVYTEDISGDRVQSVESARKVVALMQDVQRSDPDYHNIREGLAKMTVLLGYQLAHADALQEGLEQIDAGVTAYEKLASQSSRPDVIRDLAASRLRQGQVNLMRGDISAARTNFDLAHQEVINLAKLDPADVMLQSDSLGLEFEQGRLLVLTKRFAEGAATLQTVFNGFVKLNLEGDTGPGGGVMLTWLGEAQFGMRNYAGALTSYQKAAAALEKDAQYDDARCGMAAIYIRIGDAQLKLNHREDASASYKKALDTVPISFAIEHKDIPMLYPIADAQASMGDLSMALSRKSRDPQERLRLENEACASYQKSLDTWRQITQPALFNPSQYPTGNPRFVSTRMANCRAGHDSEQQLRIGLRHYSHRLGAG